MKEWERMERREGEGSNFFNKSRATIGAGQKFLGSGRSRVMGEAETREAYPMGKSDLYA